jgi:CHAT domain
MAGDELVAASQAASDALIARESTVHQLDRGPVEAAALRVAHALPEALRRELAAARTVFWSPGASGGGDTVPIELVPLTDAGPIGLTHTVCRVPSLHLLGAILAPNRWNTAAPPAATYIRADDLPGAEIGETAEEEARSTLRAFSILGLEGRLVESPSADDVLSTLREGGRLLHYAGHGVAGGAGERLILGPGRSLHAQDLAATPERRLPFVYLSACLVGRGRHIMGGTQRGFGAALLEAGAPGLVAATYAVPSHLCAEAALAFQRAAWRAPVGEAMRQSRERLAADGWHPVAWAAFALWGDPASTLAAQLTDGGSAALTLDWPALLTRQLATGAEHYRLACLQALDTAAQELPAEAGSLRAAARAIKQGAEDAELARLVSEMARFDLEGAAALRLLLADARVRWLTGVERPPDAHDRLAREIGRAIGLALALSDSYAFVHFAALHGRHLTVWMVEQASVREAAEARLNWLASDADALAAVTESIEDAAPHGSIVFDAPGLLGVSPELYARADSGDERALKELAQHVRRRRAAPATQLYGAPDWRAAMLRWIGAGSEQALSDLLGAIDADRARGRLGERLATALDGLVAEYCGPGAAAASAYAAVHTALGDDEADRWLIEVFELVDAFQSDTDAFTMEQAERGHRLTEQLGHPGAAAFLAMVHSQLLYAQGDIDQAKDLLFTILPELEALCEQDGEYRDRLLDAAQNAASFAVMEADFDAARSAARLLRGRGAEDRLGELKGLLL